MINLGGVTVGFASSITADDVVDHLVSDMSKDEFERTVHSGRVSLINKLLGLPYGTLSRRARKERKIIERNLDVFERGIQEGYAEQQKISFCRGGD